jgi:hypothetical protein
MSAQLGASQSSVGAAPGKVACAWQQAQLDFRQLDKSIAVRHDARRKCGNLDT